MLKLNDQNFEKEVLKSKKLVLVDFWAPWCGPCQMLSPILEKIEQELEEKIKIAKVNVDENPYLSSEYKIDAIPAMFIFKDGNIIEKIIGLQSEENLIKKIKSLI